MCKPSDSRQTLFDLANYNFFSRIGSTNMGEIVGGISGGSTGATVLQPLDKLQERFLRNAGVTQLEGLMVFNLAPLAARRDIAMLGLIHRTVLGKGPEQFKSFFCSDEATGTHRTRLQSRMLRHGRKLKDLRTTLHLNMARRSALGLVAVYNLLPADVVQLDNVKDFQRALAGLLKKRAQAGCEDWQLTCSPRVPLWRHPLK